jgi:hypothetical protein
VLAYEKDTLTAPSPQVLQKQQPWRNRRKGQETCAGKKKRPYSQLSLLIAERSTPSVESILALARALHLLHTVELGVEGLDELVVQVLLETVGGLDG